MGIEIDVSLFIFRKFTEVITASQRIQICSVFFVVYGVVVKEIERGIGMEKPYPAR
jgi:hypothetical protein